MPDRGYASWRPSCDTALTCFLVGRGGSFWSLGASMEGRSIPTATSDLILVNTVCFFPASSRSSFCSQSYRYLASDAPVACLCLIPLWSWKLSLDRAVDFEASKASAIPGRQRFNFDVTLPTHIAKTKGLQALAACACCLTGTHLFAPGARRSVAGLNKYWRPALLTGEPSCCPLLFQLFFLLGRDILDRGSP